MFRPMFADDPIFGAHNNQMVRMERMMDGLMPSFDDMFCPQFGMPFPELMGFPAQGRRGPPRPRPNALLPFGFGNAGSLFTGMERLASDPNCHSFSTSSVMTYSMGGDGQPKIYQASATTKTAPGGVKEVTKSTSNTATGEHKMHFGRHLGERAHIMEKSRNQFTGDQDDAEEYVNLEESDAPAFNHEWKVKTSPGGSRSGNQISNHPYQRPTLAIADGNVSDRSPQRHGKKNIRKGNEKNRSLKNS